MKDINNPDEDTDAPFDEAGSDGEPEENEQVEAEEEEEEEEDWQAEDNQSADEVQDNRDLPAFVREDETLGLSERTQAVLGSGPNQPLAPRLGVSFTPPPLTLPTERIIAAEQWPMRVAFFDRRTRITDFGIAVLLAIACFLAVAFTYKGFGHSWDEALYLKPSQLAMEWVHRMAAGDKSMLSANEISKHWGERLDSRDPVHPEVAPLPKLVIGAGLRYLQSKGIEPMTAMRLPIALLFGLTVGIIFLLASREYGRIGGFGAALCYAMMPRIFGHAHIAASETLLSFCIVSTVYMFLLGTKRWPLAVFTGVFFGLAIVTKVTAVLLPLALVLWGQIYRRRDYASNLFAMVFIAPAVALALWPWLWQDGLRKIFSFILFYADHQKTAVYYMGQVWGYNQGPAPWHYPFVISGYCVPEWILLLFAGGLLRAIAQLYSRPVPMLFVFLCVLWLGASALPAAPKYDGERLFFPLFVSVALLAGGGFSAIFAYMERVRRSRRLPDSSEVAWAAAVALGVLGLIGIVDLSVSHPNQLNYYNWLAGRPKGAYENGFETSYWGEAINEEVAGYLSRQAKPGQKVQVFALNEVAFDNLRQWGKIPSNVDFSPELPPFDLILLHVRQGFFGKAERALHMGSLKPLQTFSAQGVPRIQVFQGNALELLMSTATLPTELPVAPPAPAAQTPPAVPTSTPEFSPQPPVATPDADQSAVTSPTLNMQESGTTDAGISPQVDTTGTMQPVPVSNASVSTTAVASETPPATPAPPEAAVYEPVAPRDKITTAHPRIMITDSPPRQR